MSITNLEISTANNTSPPERNSLDSLHLGDSSVLSLPHLAGRLFNEPLAIIPSKAAEIVMGLHARFGITDVSQLKELMLFGEDEEERRRPEIEVLNGEAIIPVEGTLVNGKISSMMAAFSGLRSYQSLREDVEEAQTLPGVDRALFLMNSGGGEAAGLFDFVDWLHMTARDFPIRTFVSHMGGSAAFAVATATNEIIVSQSAHVGSVGTFLLLTNVTEANNMRGVQVIPVFAGARKVDGLPHIPLTKPAFEALQARVETMNGLLIDKVATFRNLAESDVLATEAGIFIGQQALSVGFADAVGTEDSVIQIVGGNGTMTARTTTNEPLTLAQLKEQYPEECLALLKEGETRGKAVGVSAGEQLHQEHLAQITALQEEHAAALGTAKEEGATTERTRIQAIYTLAAKAKLFETFALCAFTEPVSAEAAGGKLYEQVLNKKADARDDFSSEFIAPLDVPAPEGNGTAAPGSDEQTTAQVDILAAWVNERRQKGDRSKSEHI